ncbi:MAG: double-strand break repair protein AddB [Hyphomicrobiaceae bacterium]|nr:double-strand break repair protein AddB [Hyphomicrobiaceae bacterium]
MTGFTDNASRSGAANIFTVPPGRPFLDALAEAMLSGALGAAAASDDPMSLADVTLLLPTRRATRALQDAMLKHSGRRAVLMPRIRAIGDGDDELTLLSGLAGLTTMAIDDTDALPAISALERRLVLTQLVLAWSEKMRSAVAETLDPTGELGEFAGVGRSTPAQASLLADELGRLMDMVETEGVSLGRMAELVPDTYSEHWKKTLDFLEIITAFWPAHLAERALASPAAGRNRSLELETRRLIESPPKSPVIVAGVTGSIPATAALMRAVAGLDNGFIVLPALDMHLDEVSWRAIRPTDEKAAAPRHFEHPQHGMKTLLDRLGVDRADVRVLPGAEPTPAQSDRLSFVAEAMRPASTTAAWHDYASTVDRDRLRAGLSGISLIDAPAAQDEAEAVALILREALEVPGRTAALVSPDRLLARRVAARLESWGIRVDDSAGRPFGKTVPGAFLDLVIEAVDSSFAPAALMALLKHPLTRFGLGAFEVRRAARALELAAFRTEYLGQGLDGVEAALEQAAADVANRERRERPVRRLWKEDWEGARDLVIRLKSAFAPLTALYATREAHLLGTLAAAHIAAAEAVARLPDGEVKPLAPGEEENEGNRGRYFAELYRGDAGDAAARLFAGFVSPDLPQLDIAAADYADLYRSLIARENIRPKVPLHPRLFIWGPFEARLQQPDVVILGSLNDGTWPEAAEPGPWLNRPMRRELGLPSPEEMIGYAAHDFTSLLGAERVYLTRAEKIDGVPTVPSRWLMRIVALLDGLKMRDAIAMEKPWLGWARTRDAIAQRQPCAPPEPCPDVAKRPRRLSVSGVETWIANPYAIYAQHILALDPLSPLGTVPDASLKGAIIHDILAELARRHPRELPADTRGALVAIAREKLAPYLANPRIAAFWLPRFERFAAWFAGTEPARRLAGGSVLAEISGRMVLDGPAGPFELTARADRLDVSGSGIVITDYKTGTPPSDKAVAAGRSPQLPLEAAIAIAGGFAGIETREVSGLSYIRITGGTPPGEERQIGAPVAELAAAQTEGLSDLIARFDDASTPYSARRRPGFSYEYDDYEQLARVAEWSDLADEGETED